jgi:anti-sigma factor RsiW
MDSAPLTDEELVAFLDKALPSDRCAEIERMRASDAALQERLTALEIDVDAIRSAFDLHLAAAPVDNLRRYLAVADPQPKSRATRDSRWMHLPAAAMIGVVLGSGVTHFLHRPPAPDWLVAIAEYQALYTTDTLKPLNSNPALIANQVQAAAAALGRPMLVQNLQVAGLELKRAQVLAFEHRPLVQFAYLDREGTPIAFCATRTNALAEPVHTTTLNGLAAAVWNRDGYGYVVIGGTDTAAIQAIAHTLEHHT